MDQSIRVLDYWSITLLIQVSSSLDVALGYTAAPCSGRKEQLYTTVLYCTTQ